VSLSSPTGGAQLGEIADSVVYITDDDGTGKLVDEAERLAAEELKRFDIGSSSWGKQFTDAMTITGEFDEDGGYLPPSTFDYVMHFLTFFWKVLFAIVPPTDIWGGWAAFLGSLAIIGGLTAIVGELAGLFGCVIGLKDPITAITFVALGTSLPDTFASKAAVLQEEYADAAIGNVVGSNSVNVFLGLGLPWVMAAIIKLADGEDYNVPAGSLAFSVTVFAALACVALLILLIRRKTVGGELGGPGKWIVAAIFVSMWLLYVILVSLEVEGHISGF
jgi:solute carrier family 8 (sodium/calcium exchanger)